MAGFPKLRSICPDEHSGREKREHVQSELAYQGKKSTYWGNDFPFEMYNMMEINKRKPYSRIVSHNNRKLPKLSIFNKTLHEWSKKLAKDFRTKNFFFKYSCRTKRKLRKKNPTLLGIENGNELTPQRLNTKSEKELELYIAKSSHTQDAPVIRKRKSTMQKHA